MSLRWRWRPLVRAMTPWRHHLRRARFAATALIAAALIGAAVFVGLVQVLLPLATQHPAFIARELSARLHRPVKFAAIHSEWQPSGPLLTVRDLTVGPAKPGGQSITLPHAALKFDFSAWLRPARRWITLRVSGLELRVERSPSGWVVVGFANAADATHASLQSLPVDLDLRDLRVDVIDSHAHHAWQLVSPRLRVVNVGDSIRFGGRIQRLGTRQAVTVSGRVNTAARDYDLYVTTSGFDLAEASRSVDLHGYAIRSGQADLDAWGSWRGGKLQSVAATYTVRDLVASGPHGRGIAAPLLSGVVQAKRATDGWDVAWRGPGKARADIDEAGGVVANLSGHAGAWRVTAAAHAVDATPWLALLAMLPQAPPAAVAWVTHAQPHVRLDAAALVWQQGGDFHANARISGLRAAATGAIPGLALATGTLRADNHAVSLELPAQAATVALTDVFRKPFVFKRLSGTLAAWREADAWQIAATGLQFDTGTLAGRGHAQLTWFGHGRAPFLSAYAAVDHANATDASLFWPYRSMPPSLVSWLDHAFVGGTVTNGRVVVRGDLADWPFLDHKGRFEAIGTVSGATFHFADGWPNATALDADVDFIDNSMGIVATAARVRGASVTHAVATIPDLAHGVLGLDITGNGSGAELLDFVRHSPIGADGATALAGLTVGGSGKFGVRLSIPLDKAEDFTLGGKVDLAKADVTNPQWNLSLKNLNGTLALQGRGFNGKALAASFRGAPAKVSIAVGAGNVANPADVVEASLATKVSAQTLTTGYPDLAGLVAHASGVAPFQVGVTVTSGTGSAPAVPKLEVQSNLTGIALDLPAPLNKPADAVWPLDVSLPLPPDGAALTVSLGDVLRVRGRLADPARHTPTALAVNFGATLPTRVPAQGLVVGGHAATLDVSGWVSQAMLGSSGGGFPQLSTADVDTDAASVFGTQLGALQLGFKAEAGADAITLDGPAVAGTLSVPTENLMARGITADFKYLHWPEAPEPKHPGPPTPPPSTSPVAPMDIPPLHVTVGDLQLGASQLGATLFESAPTLAGMHIAKFNSKGADFSTRSSGDWNGNRAFSQSHMQIAIDSHDLGKTLTAFGFGGLLAGGKNAVVQIDGTWPGAPSGFSLAWMDGTLAIKADDGRILAVKPGLGRMLGLLSLRELPSRLTLHFGDVFGSGFGFDHAAANFTLKDGSAFTQDLAIEAPAAQIHMRGRTGFRAKDYDLTVNVTPHIGGTLPVVGAVIGGPVGAAAGLVVQGILGKGINHAAGSIYRVTGSWDKPKIESVAAAPASAASVPAPASTAAPAAAGSTGPVASAPAPAVGGSSD